MSELTGTWCLVATRAWDDGNNELPEPYGPMARGLVQFEENMQMMCVLADGRAELPGADADAVREYVSYMGHFTYADNVLSTRVEGSTDASRIGSDQVRQVRFEGERLILRPPPRPKYGVTENRELEWMRIS